MSVLTREFRAAAERVLEQLRAPGLTAAFKFRDGRAGSVAVGLADVESAKPMRANDRMLGGSTGKSFVAATALALSREGRLSLDEPLSSMLGARNWFNRVPNANELTLRLLLRHAGGVPDHMGDPDPAGRLAALREIRGIDAYFTPEECVEFILDAQPVAVAGAGFFYSDTGYILAGLGIESATGKSLESLIARYVLTPLDMNDTAPANARCLDRLATPYLSGSVRFLDKTGCLPFSPRTEWAGGGHVTTARDLATFIDAYAGDPATRELMTTDPIYYSWAPTHLGAYGLGVFLAHSPLGPAIGHGGYYPGFRSQMTHFTAHGLSVAYQCNSADAFSSYAATVEARRIATTKSLDPTQPLTVVNDSAAQLAAALLKARG